jgi:DNA-binding SARP family transcriptional activator
VFGGVAVERSGVPVAETAEVHKALALLVLVAASRDRGISRDQLAAYLWPESQSENARAALSQTLYTLAEAPCQYTDRPAFDRVRGDPSLANLLHVPALDRPSTRTLR